MPRLRESVVWAVMAAGALGLGAPADARAAERDVPVAGPLPTVPVHVPDRVLPARGGARAAAYSAASLGARTRSYRTPQGQRVEVAVSAAYPDDAAADQRYVDFLATRMHGAELGGLRLFVGRPAEVARLCGGAGVVACYAPDEQRIYVPGEETRAIPVEYALTHEYGHHIASLRRNDPWDALDWGPKRWASTVGVCAGIARRQLFADDYERHYLDNPGEGFADGYAHLHYPQQSWRYNPLMHPTMPVLAAIQRDVLEPWTGPRTRVLRGTRSGRVRLRLALDGDVTLRLRAPRGTRYEIEARSAGWGIGRSLRRGAQLGIEWCRKTPDDAGMTIRVRRLRGHGRFRLTVRYPG